MLLFSNIVNTPIVVNSCDLIMIASFAFLFGILIGYIAKILENK